MIRLKATKDTIIRFGKFNGKKIRNVPASYLLWCYDNIAPRHYIYSRNKDIFTYIKDNIENLKREAKNE